MISKLLAAAARVNQGQAVQTDKVNCCLAARVTPERYIVMKPDVIHAGFGPRDLRSKAFHGASMYDIRAR
jgi:hypothetical protein